MSGQNFFPHGRGDLNKSLTEKTAGIQKPCVFISHRTCDKPAARTIARLLMDFGIDIYFDERDPELQLGVAQSDDRMIAQCIEDGLNKSTHLIGIISKDTKDSWWVPYEIGGATGRGCEVAHLILKGSGNLPSYIITSRILKNRDSLADWISEMSSNTNRGASDFDKLHKSMNKARVHLNSELERYVR